MKYIFLSKKFFQEYTEKDYPEIERKAERPYVMVQISINGIDFGIPLRSNISHNHALWTNKVRKCGADYSKAVIIPDETYIDERKPYIRVDEHDLLKGKEHMLKKGFEKYICDYIKALKEIHIERNRVLCKFSTLQYYHKELHIQT